MEQKSNFLSFFLTHHKNHQQLLTHSMLPTTSHFDVCYLRLLRETI